MTSVISDSIEKGRLQLEYQKRRDIIFASWLADHSAPQAIVDEELSRLIAFLKEFERNGFLVTKELVPTPDCFQYIFSVTGKNNDRSLECVLFSGTIELSLVTTDSGVGYRVSGNSKNFNFFFSGKPEYRNSRLGHHGFHHALDLVIRQVLDTIASGEIMPINEALPAPESAENARSLWSVIVTGLKKIIG